MGFRARKSFKVMPGVRMTVTPRAPTDVDTPMVEAWDGLVCPSSHLPSAHGRPEAPARLGSPSTPSVSKA